MTDLTIFSIEYHVPLCVHSRIGIINDMFFIQVIFKSCDSSVAVNFQILNVATNHTTTLH